MSNDEFQPRSAVKFSGTYSPGNTKRDLRAAPLERISRTRVGIKRKQRTGSGKTRAWLIIALTSPLVFSAIKSVLNGNAFAAMGNLGLFAMFCFAAFTIRSGIDAAMEYEAHDFALAPKFPRKIIGAALTGAGLLLTCWTGWGIGLLQSAGFGIMGFASALFAFGPDPLKDKGSTTSTGITPDMVISAITEAEEKIGGIEAAGASLQDRPLRDRINRITKRARDILSRIEDDPSDLRRSRKFLVVYLDGALEATQKYVKSQNDLSGEKDIYIKFRSMLDDMEREFDDQHDKLLKNDRIELDVEIDVLADRLKTASRL